MEVTPVSERRRTNRLQFEASVELILPKSHDRITAVTGDINLSGCFVKTMFSFPGGASVKIHITGLGRTFSSMGTVLYIIKGQGMGIVFGEMKVSDKLFLRELVAELHVEPVLTRP
jgi:hypothetical protein